MKEKISERSKKLYLNQMVGVLSTHSFDVTGYPFGSIVPYTYDRFYRPVVLISRLAQHTKNIQIDPKISLFISDVESVGFDDVQTCSRLTILADAEKVSDQETIDRFCRFYPDAEMYHRDLDFDFYRLVPKKTRFIGGFGKIHWVDNDKLFTQSPFSEEQERDIIEHINADHAETLPVYCQKAGVSIPDGVLLEMVGVDADGFHIRVGRKLIRISFERTLNTPMDARQAFIELLRG